LNLKTQQVIQSIKRLGL